MTWRTEQAWNVTKTLGRKMGLHKPYWTILYLLDALSQKTAGDVPVHRDVWETQYAAGKWEYLRHPAELGRYALLEGYIKKLGLKRILDIGCGEGILLEYLWPYAYDLYVGVDVSATALQSTALKSGKQTRFIQADAATFQPAQSFDAVVFNESLYYLHATPLCVLEQYIPAIKLNGYLLISLFMETKRNQKIDKQLKNCPWLQLVYEITATTVNKQGRILTWRCSVWRPNRQTEKCAA